MTELLVGCGYNRRKRVSFAGMSAEWHHLTTLDNNPACAPDVVHDLNVLPYPFADNTFDEIHAYEVLEHCGTQGDVRFFFGQFGELWRILKPNGYFIASVPMWDSPWAWGDPGHTRVLTKESLVFLAARNYAEDGDTPMSDYRAMLVGSFETVGIDEGKDRLGFVLRAIK